MLNIDRSTTIVKNIYLYFNLTQWSKSELLTLHPPAASFQKQLCGHMVKRSLIVVSIIVFSPIRSRSSSGELLGPVLVDLDLTSEIGFKSVRLCCIEVKARALTECYRMISLKGSIRQVEVQTCASSEIDSSNGCHRRSS